MCRNLGIIVTRVGSLLGEVEDGGTEKVYASRAQNTLSVKFSAPKTPKKILKRAKNYILQNEAILT